MARRYPKNGILSGMVLTYGSGIVAGIIGLGIPSWRAVFEAEASPQLLNYFLVSIFVLIAHKVESYFWGEYDACPVYRTLGEGAKANPRQQTFLTAIPLMMIGLLLVAMVMRGSPWVLLFFLIWAGQGLHEWHHLAKTLAARRYYPGLFTGLAFVGSVALLVFPAWVESLGVDRTWWYRIYYGLHPVIIIAFYLEHRGYLAKLKDQPPAPLPSA